MKALHLLFKPKPTFSNVKPTSSSQYPLHRASQEQILEIRFISLIHSSKTIHRLRQVHSQIFRHYLFSSSRVVTQLISSCFLQKSVNYALSIFHNFEPKNLFVFNALIRGLADNFMFERSISYFIVMMRLNVNPDWLTFPFVLKSAAGLNGVGIGKAFHGGIFKFGFEFDSFVRVSLVDMYVKMEELECAWKAFDESPERIKCGSVLLWNVLINGYCKVGDLAKAKLLFDAMPERDTGSWNSLINGFMKNGDTDRATELFEQMPEKNVISWTTMVNGFSQNDDPEKALSMFFRVLKEGVMPNDFTIVSSVSACAKVGALDAGVRIHRFLSDNNFLLGKAIGTALVDMYAKCGNVESAGKAFGETKEKDLLTWSVMIWGWAIHGHFEQALQYFGQMKSAGIRPDGVVFLAILTACSHSGKVNQGLHFFNSMRLDYLIEPTMKHYTLVIDMLGRAGRLDEALDFIQQMPINPDFVVWGALFCACRAHKNIEMAELAAEKLLQLEPKHPGGYVFLSNVYAAVGRWEDAERVRSLMRNRGAEKDPGWSFIEMESQVHRFVAGDHDHDQAKEIYLKLEEITARAREKGHSPETECVLRDIEEEEKEDALGNHSEKLALAFGLINTAPGAIIRIVKNLRVCGDCHSFMKYASEISQREIVVRDIKRFHHFKYGACSCGDYW